jgi:hypothetical protein
VTSSSAIATTLFVPPQLVEEIIASARRSASRARSDEVGYLFFDERRRDDLRDGTFAPFSRASLNPIAIACFRLLTFLPDPLFNEPFLRRRIADSTFFDADLPYLAILTSLTDAGSRG